MSLSETAFVALSYFVLFWIVAVAIYIVYITINRREELLEQEAEAPTNPET